MLQMPSDTNTVQTPQTSTIQETKPKQPEFGSGRYSIAMKEVYQDGIRIFRFSPEVAEKVARQFGSDFGAYMRDSVVETKIGKSINKDGKLTLAEASKVKGCTATNAILIARAIDYCNNALKFGVSVRETKWTLAQELADWIDSLAK